MAVEAPTQGSAPDREALRAELEATRAGFHRLLDSLSAEDWKQKSANPAWSVGQLMWHLGFGMEFFPRAIEYCRKGKGPNPPEFFIGIGNVLLTRFGSRGATPQSAREKYNAAHDQLIGLLGSVGDDEWSKSARIYHIDYTITKVFTEVGVHFREHEADIKEGLGRADTAG